MSEETTSRPPPISPESAGDEPPRPNSGSGQATFAALAVDNFEGRVKDNLAQLLLTTARDLASECEKIEREQAGLDWPRKGGNAFKAWP